MRDIAIGNPEFRDLIENDCIYVDKTMYIHELLRDKTNRFYFLSRPRRFGKSLFCSTLHSLFDGDRELFKGTYIAEKTDYDFEKHPVIHFDFSSISLISEAFFLESVQEKILDAAIFNGVTIGTGSPDIMLKRLVHALIEKTGKQVVIIIDEFDSAIITAILENSSIVRYVMSTFNAFYKMIKANSGNIRFFFMTGCVKLANLSIFSAMNNLVDISMKPEFAGAFGYTQEELLWYFREGIDEYLSAHDDVSRDEFIEAVGRYYDGYRFSYDTGLKVYNPVSIGMFFSNGFSFRNYWMETGVATLAIKLAENCRMTDLLSGSISISAFSFSSFDIQLIGEGTLPYDGVGVFLYYAGYLTIRAADYPYLELCFPNAEVGTSFTSTLVPRFMERAASVRPWGRDFINACRSGDAGSVMSFFEDYFAAFSYELTSRDRERIYQVLFDAVFIMMGQLVYAEDRGAKGRIDTSVIAGEHIWLFEFKVDMDADAALSQMAEKEYSGKYRYCLKPGMRIHRIGISFSTETRSIREWKEAEPVLIEDGDIRSQR